MSCPDRTFSGMARENFSGRPRRGSKTRVRRRVPSALLGCTRPAAASDRRRGGNKGCNHRHPASVDPSAQRISDWKAGTNVPASFEALLPVLLELIERAKNRSDAVESRLVEPHRWRRLWEAASSGAPVSVDDAHSVCPYLGLAPCGPDQADRFFGRTRATESLVDLVGRSATGGGITLLIGASGAGKSSLLAAGLIPAVASDDSPVPGSAQWPVVRISPGATPLHTLLAQIPTLQIDVDDIDPAVVRAQTPAWSEGRQVLIVVDQGEEMFTVCTDDVERSAFLATLSAMTQRDDEPPAAVVVIGIRADFYARCLEYPELEGALQRRSLALGPMRITERREAIALPAKAVGLKLEPGLEDLIVVDLCGIGSGKRRRTVYNPGALPLLSHVLAGTWQHRRGNKLTVAGYRAADGTAGSLSATADRVWAELDEPAQHAARYILLGLVQVGDDSRDSRRTRQREELLGHLGGNPDAAGRALEALADSRLVTLDAASVTLAYEVIIDAWPPLRSRIDEDRAGNLLRQRLEKDADEWVSQDRDRELLYAGTRLGNATDWAKAQQPDAVPGVVDQFLTASSQRGLDRQRRRRNTFAALAAVAADREGDAAEASRDDAVYRGVLTESDRMQSEDPSLAAQLDLVAHHLRPDDRSVDSRILATQDQALATTMTGHQGAVYTVAYSPVSTKLASASDDKTIRLWDVSDHDHPKQLGKPLVGHTSFLTSAVFSPDGRTLASASSDHTVRLWDIADPARPKPLGEPLIQGGGTVYVLAFSPDGRTLAAPNDDHTVTLWNVSDRTKPTALGTPLIGQNGPVRTLAFSPDGRTLATGSDDSTVQLWNLTDVAAPVPWGPPLTGFTRAAHSVAFSPDGSKLAAGSDDTTAQLWNVTGPCASGPARPPHRSAQRGAVDRRVQPGRQPARDGQLGRHHQTLESHRSGQPHAGGACDDRWRRRDHGELQSGRLHAGSRRSGRGCAAVAAVHDGESRAHRSSEGTRFQRRRCGDGDGIGGRHCATVGFT